MTELYPAGAAAYAAEAFKQGGSERLLRHTAEAYAEKDPSAASIDDSGLRNRAVGAVARTWTASAPAEAATWIGNLADPAARNSAAAAFSTRLARTDPATAAQWAVAITDANARNRTVADVVRTWKRADAAAATAFVQASPILSPELKQRLLR